MKLEERFFEYIHTSEDSFLTQKSEIWSSLIKMRQSELSSENLSNFLSNDSSQATGTGNSKRFSGIIDEVSNYLSDIIDPEYLEKIPASSVGQPNFITFEGFKTYTAHLWNIARFQHYHKFLMEKGYLNQQLNILEIGPGYGAAAYNFIELGNVRSYTLVDLKENLINSYYFLTQNYPDWEVNFVDKETPPKLDSKCLNFVTADRIDQLSATGKFDLFVNSDSFGEMPRDVAKSYLGMLPKLIKDGGILISMNGHRRGQYELGGILRVSDYGYADHQSLLFSFKKYFSSSFDDFGHISISTNTRAEHDLTLFYDVIGDLIAMGLNTDLEQIIDNFNSSSLSEVDLRNINHWNDLLDEKTLDAEDTQLVSRYILFLRNTISRRQISENEFEYLIKSLKSPQALFYCKLCKLIVSNDWSVFDEAELSNTEKFLSSDILKYRNASSLKKYIYLKIRKAHLQKKAFPRRAFKLPLVLKGRQQVERLLVKRNW